MKKQEVINDYYDALSNCPSTYINTSGTRKQKRWITDANALKAELVFDPADDFNIPTFPDQTEPNQQILDHCANICESYKDQWLFELKACIASKSISSTDVTAIMNKLYTVCYAGCDMDHPYGSREANPNIIYTTPIPMNFKEALGVFWDNNLCDDLNLSWPMGWEHDYYAGANPNDNECACDEDKFKPYRGVACPDEIETEVIDNCLCNEAENSTLPEYRQALQTIDVPEAAKCKNCIDCSHLRMALKEYRDIYQNDFFDDPVRDEQRLTTFLNLKFQMNQQYSDYLAFAVECFGLLLISNDFDGLMDIVSPSKYLSEEYFVLPGSYWDEWIGAMNIPEENGLELALNDGGIDYITEELPVYQGQRPLPLIPYTYKQLEHKKNPENYLASLDDQPVLIFNSAVVDAPEKCACREIINAKIQSENGLISNIPDGLTPTEVYNTLYGTSLTDAQYTALYNECCCYYQQLDIAVPPTNCATYSPQDPCIITELLDASWSDAAAPWMTSFDPNDPLSPLVLAGIAQNCPPQDEPCTNELKPLDECGCKKLIAAFEAMYALNSALRPDNIVDEQLRLQMQAQFGIQLPPGVPYGAMLNNCFTTWANAFGEISPGVLPTVVPLGAGRDGDGYLEWDGLGRNQLNTDARQFEWQLPKILSCTTGCDNPPPPDPDGYPCTKPECGDLTQWYRDFLDANNLEYFTWPDEMLDGSWWMAVMSTYRKTGQDAWNLFPFQLNDLAAYLESQALAAGHCPSSGLDDYFYDLMYYCFRPTHWSPGHSFGGTWGNTGPTGGVRIWPVKPAPCPDRCYKVDRTKLYEVKDYLNQLLKDKEKILHVNKAHYFVAGSPNPARDIPEYYSFFYPPTLLATMKQNIRHVLNDNGIPHLDFTVTDQNYPANDRDITLLFTELAYVDLYNWRLVKSIDEIDYFKNTLCGTTISDETFVMLVTVEVPLSLASKYCPTNLPCIKQVKMMGTMENLNLHSDITEFSCPNCALLCNKPLLPQPTEDPCVTALDHLAKARATYRYELEKERLINNFKSEYIEKCRQFEESFTMEYPLREYHYTLYYYDQADNLIKTVPPEGVHPLTPTEQATMAAYRSNPSNPSVLTSHEFITYYQYNTLNGLVWQSTPDGGVSRFWYDKLGRLVLSQHEKQEGQDQYFYNLFDGLGRQSEVGEITLGTVPLVGDVLNPTWVTTNLVNSTAKTQITRTIYEEWLFSIPGFSPENTLARVVSSLYYENYSATMSDFDHATHYSYDIHGSVKHLVQDNPSLADFQQQYKHLVYKYDLISGNINIVAYQPEEADQFFHYYRYDGNNRLKETYTSRQPMAWDVDFGGALPQFTYSTSWIKESKEYFYPHGPLARREFGQHLVQGIDYSYTLHGWMKSINSASMTRENDPGRDAYTGTNALVARDAIGLELGYYLESWGAIFDDYTSIRPTDHISEKAGSNVEHWIKNLYNGNISHAVYAIPDPNTLPTSYTPSPRAGVYEYDQLNRLRNSYSFANFNGATNTWQNNLSNLAPPEPWQENLTYDANGNILTLERTGKAGIIDMDEMAYTYPTVGVNANRSNRLGHVDDAKSASFATNYPEDMEDQSSGNYSYDEIGNLVSDVAEEIAAIEWNVYGKIKRITRLTGSQKPDMEFAYNSSGQRIMKRVIPANGDPETHTWYALDAAGNVMAVYETQDEIDGSELTRTLFTGEFMIYGSARLGMKKIHLDLAEVVYTIEPNQDLTFQTYTSLIGAAPDLEIQVLGFTRYELSNHLRNVMTVVSDRKLGVPNGGNTGYDYFLPEVVNLYDYYPFGSPMPGRSFIAEECSTTLETKFVHENCFELPSTSLSNLGTHWVMNVTNSDCSPPTTPTVPPDPLDPPTITYNNDWVAETANTDLAHSGSTALYAEANDPVAPYMVWTKVMGALVTGKTYTLKVNLLASVGSDFKIEVYDAGTSSILHTTPTLVSGTTGNYIWIFTLSANSGDVRIRFVGENNSLGSYILFDDFRLSYSQTSATLLCRNLEGYRFGFNGQEKDNEVSGTGNTNSAEYWQYDSRLARRWNLDPVTKVFESPYACFSNNPLRFVDIDGSDTFEFNTVNHLTIFTCGNDGNCPEPSMTSSSEIKVKSAEGKDVFIFNTETHTYNAATGKLTVTKYSIELKPFDGYHSGLSQSPGWLGIGSFDDMDNVTLGKLMVKSPELTALLYKRNRELYWCYYMIGLEATFSEVAFNIAATIFIVDGLLLKGSAALSATDGGLITVGRWMSPAEYKAMKNTGRMVEGAGGQTFVSVGGPTAWKAAEKGSVFVEFQVPAKSLLQGGQANYFKVIGPSATTPMKEALKKKGGEMLPAVDNLTDILYTK